jgi:hypothetical protein
MPTLSLRSKTTSPFLFVAMFLGVVYLLLDQYTVNKADIDSLLASKSLSVWGNIIEGLLWMAMGSAFACHGGYFTLKHKQWQLRSLLTSVLLVLFGLSDFVEAQTGHWWKPWPLLLLKAVCLFGLLAMSAFYLKKRSLLKSA